jgi:hypothetical protein
VLRVGGGGARRGWPYLVTEWQLKSGFAWIRIDLAPLDPDPDSVVMKLKKLKSFHF